MKSKEYLYKYRSDDLFTIKLLCEQRLHFSNPCDFNDPFDCRPPCSEIFTEEKILSCVTGKYPLTADAIKQNMPFLKQVLSVKEQIQSEVEEVLNSLYLCCMSSNANSSLMWAHYSGNHTGLCLCFDPSKGGSYINPGAIKKVEYVSTREIADISNINEENISKILTQKYKSWEYEDEVRIMKSPAQMIINGELQNQFEKSALVAIFFGLRMPQERQEFYRLLCKQCGLENVKFFKMTLPTDGTYFLVPKEI